MKAHYVQAAGNAASEVSSAGVSRGVNRDPELPLHLAHRMLAAVLPATASCTAAGALADCQMLAAVVVDRLEPVEIICITFEAQILKLGLCPCGQSIRWPDMAHPPKYCHDCGKPLTWFSPLYESPIP